MPRRDRPPGNSRLRMARKEREWSHRKLADLLGTTDVTISRWENAVVMPSPYFRQRLCELFGMSDQELGLIAVPVEKETEGEDRGESCLSALLVDHASSPPSAPAEAISLSSSAPLVIKNHLWYVPYLRNKFFLDSCNIIQSVHTSFVSSHQEKQTQVVIIQGRAGSGKTQAAVEYAYQHCQSYRYIFWLYAATPQTLAASCARLSHLLGLALTPIYKLHEVVCLVQEWLHSHDDWLLILDDVVHFSYINEYIATSKHCHILVTTRDQHNVMPSHTIALSALTEENAVAFVLRRNDQLLEENGAGNRTQVVSENARLLIKEIGTLPLVLGLVEAILSQRLWSLSTYLTHYREQRERLGQADALSRLVALHVHVFQMMLPEGLPTLYFLAFFQPTMLPFPLLQEGLNWLYEQGQLTGGLISLQSFLSSLADLGLIHYHRIDGIIHISTTVRTILREMLSPSEKNMWAERVVDFISTIFLRQPLLSWDRYAYYVDLSEICQQDIVGIDTTLSKKIIVAPLIDSFAYHMHIHTKQYACARSLYILTLEPYQDVSEENYVRVANSLVRLVSLYLIEREYAKASELFTQGTQILQSYGVPYDSQLASFLSDIASLFYDLGNYMLAQRGYTQAFAIWSMHSEQHLSSMAVCHRNFGMLYMAWSQYEQAEQELKMALEIHERFLKPERLEIASHLDALGELYRVEARHTMAEALLQSSLAIREKTLGSEHQAVAESLSHLGTLFMQYGDYTRSEEYHHRVLHLLQKIACPEHPCFAQSLHNLGLLALRQTYYKQAEQFLQKALQHREERCGAEHPEVAESIHVLAVLLTFQQRYKEAQQLFQRALKQRAHFLGARHPAVAQTLSELGQLFFLQEDFVEAHRLYQQALDIYTNWLRPEHPDTIAVLKRDVATLQKMGKHEEAMTLREKISKVYLFSDYQKIM